MNTQKIYKAVVIVWMALALSFGTGILGGQLGIEVVGQTHACGLTGDGGGGC